MQPLLSVQNLKKKFCRSLKRSLWYGVADITSDMLALDRSELVLRKDEFLAVDDISFDVQPGESVALIGGNGAGKSTVLKMINGLFQPDAGRIEVKGKVSALIELGAGFNPILSGRENVYVNAAVLGMKKKEVDRQMDEIIDFAELEDFIDMPLKSYSSGMKVRLGFAVASQLKPDLLLIDEVLAVGDATFRAKCHRRLASLLSEGTAFVLVSHNHHMLTATCSKGVVLERGKMIANDEITNALHAYDNSSTINEPPQLKRPADHKNDTGLCIQDIFFRDVKGDRVAEPKTGHPASLCMQVLVDKPLLDVWMSVLVIEYTWDGRSILAITSSQDGVTFDLQEGLQEIQLDFEALPFTAGTYFGRFSLGQGVLNTLDLVDGFIFGVDSGLSVGDSAVYFPRSWNSVTHNQPTAILKAGS